VAFKDDVFDEFTQLQTVWGNLGKKRVFWRTGNALHACINFILAARAAWGANDPKTSGAIADVWQMLGEARDTFYLGCPPPPPGGIHGPFNTPCWRDDYGWWGLAFLQTYENFAIFGKPDPTVPDCYDASQPVSSGCCLSMAHDCWAFMWKKAWDREGDVPVAGGCWNLKGKGVQNTVTNVLFLALSIRLYSATKNLPGWSSRAQDYLDAACQQYQWFGRWLIKGADRATGIGVGIYNYVQRPFPSEPDRVWILERPMNGDESYNYLGCRSTIRRADFRRGRNNTGRATKASFSQV